MHAWPWAVTLLRVVRRQQCPSGEEAQEEARSGTEHARSVRQQRDSDSQAKGAYGSSLGREAVAADSNRSVTARDTEEL